MHYCDTSAIAAITERVFLQQVAVHDHDAVGADIDFGLAYHLRLLGRHGPGSVARDNSAFANWHENSAGPGY